MVPRRRPAPSMRVVAAWTDEDLKQIASAEEVKVAGQHPDGTLGNPVTVWCVGDGDTIYIRSAVKGRSAGWYRGVEQTHRGRIWVGRIQKDVEFVDADSEVNDQVDTAYRAKYRRYAGPILDSCLTPEARSTTLRVTPHSTR